MKQNNFQKLSLEWLGKGDNDFTSAKILLEENGPTETICFHCHQLVEKYLKGYLVFQGINIGKNRKWKIHILPKLWRECKKFDSTFDEIKDECVNLNQYYLESRYPMDQPKEYPTGETKESIKAAEKIKTFILQKIK